MTERIGYWLDMDDPYITLDNDYIESVWWILKKYFDAGLIYEGHKIMPYCARCGTPLASHEVSQGYKEEKINLDLCKDAGSRGTGDVLPGLDDDPLTLPSNVALAINPAFTYVRPADQTTSASISCVSGSRPYWAKRPKFFLSLRARN